MKEIKIIQYSSFYHDKLYAYIEKNYLNRPKQYIDYCLNNLTDNIQGALLCLDEKDEIVGCQLCFPTKALIKGEEQYIAWGHDLRIDEDYRGDAGMMLMLEVSQLPVFGMGLSDINKKIQKVLGSTFFDNIIIYGRLNRFFIRSAFQGIVRKRNSLTHFYTPDKIQTRGQSFSKVNDAASLKIPNGGYWWGKRVDIDFIRDYDYLSKRFFNNFNKYYFYRLSVQEEYDSCYFVIRPIVYKKIVALSIVDFRYDLNKPDQFSLITEAVNRIAKINKIGMVFYISNINHKKTLIKFSRFSILSFFPLLMKRNPDIDYIACPFFHLSKSATSVATQADADGDFLCESPVYVTGR
jgi:hypothetical protein